MLFINASIQITENEFEFTAARSSGPGGQNVNKVNSKVVLRWNAVESQCLPVEIKQRFLEKYQTKLTRTGDVIVTCDMFRDQPRNRLHCLQKIKEMILTVLYPPKKRRETKPTYSSKRKRTDGKRKEGEKKASRRKVTDY